MEWLFLLIAKKASLKALKKMRGIEFHLKDKTCTHTSRRKSYKKEVKKTKDFALNYLVFPSSGVQVLGDWGVVVSLEKWLRAGV